MVEAMDKGLKMSDLEENLMMTNQNLVILYMKK